MNTRFTFLACFFVFLCANLNAKKYTDTSTSNLKKLFSHPNSVYVLKYNHVFYDTLNIPQGSTVIFKGGSLCGPIKMRNATFKGDVRLQGSTLYGKYAKSRFHANWICYCDNKHDDAKVINNIVKVADSVFFDRGVYRLHSIANVGGDIPPSKAQFVKCNIAIHRSNVTILGEKGSILSADNPSRVICIYSKPGDIANSIKNIAIKGLTIRVKNNGKDFFEVNHSVTIIGAKGVTIENCYFDDFWGDAICLSHYADEPYTGELARNENIKIINNTIVGGTHHNNRNGISVIGGKNVTIKNNTIKNTSRNDMPGAIDVEANNSVFTVDHIYILSNTIDGCQGTAGGICINCNKLGGQAHNIYIERNRIYNSRSGLAFVVEKDDTSSNYAIRNNIVDDKTLSMQFVGKGRSSNWVFENNIFKSGWRHLSFSLGIKIENLQIKNNSYR